MGNGLEVWRRNRPNSIFDFMNEVDEMFNRAWIPATTTQGESEISSWYKPSVDVHETDKGYLLSFDVPGVKKDEIKIDLSENTLTVSGERKHESHKDLEGGGYRYEKQYGKFQRSFTLPANIEVEKIEARYEDGVLEILVPKAESAKPKSIKVGAGQGGLFSRFLGQKDVAKTPKTDEEKH